MKFILTNQIVVVLKPAKSLLSYFPLNLENSLSYFIIAGTMFNTDLQICVVVNKNYIRTWLHENLHALN